MIDNNKNIFDIDVFTKLIKVAQDSSNFENYKTPFLFNSHFYTK